MSQNININHTILETMYKVNGGHLGYNVKRLREILGVKQEDLAERLNLTQQSVSKLENRENMNKETLEKIANAMNIPSYVIMNYSDEEAMNIVSNYSDNAMAYNYLQINNPVERIIELYEQKVALYERMLQSEKDKVALLENLLRDKCK